MSGFQINDEVWASQLQRGLDEYMMRLADSVDEDSDVETLTGQPYCGCSDCFWREILAYATPILLQGQLDKKIELA
jgi:hypothetical protein